MRERCMGYCCNRWPRFVIDFTDAGGAHRDWPVCGHHFGTWLSVGRLGSLRVTSGQRPL